MHGWAAVIDRESTSPVDGCAFPDETLHRFGSQRPGAGRLTSANSSKRPLC